jgi:hypothetical protein
VSEDARSPAAEGLAMIEDLRGASPVPEPPAIPGQLVPPVRYARTTIVEEANEGVADTVRCGLDRIASRLRTSDELPGFDVVTTGTEGEPSDAIPAVGDVELDVALTRLRERLRRSGKSLG